MANAFDQFDMESTNAFDAVEANPFDSFDEPSKKAPKNTVMNSIQDIARVFLPLATTGVNAIIGAGEAAIKGEGIVGGLQKGAQKADIFGFDLGMETSAGKFVEEKLGTALEYIRSTSGETGSDILKNESARKILSALPTTKPFMMLYENADDSTKVKMEAAVNAGSAAAPEVVAAILGGKAISKEKKTPTNTLDKLIADTELEMANQAVPESVRDVSPIDYVKPDADLELAPLDTTPAPTPEAGLDFYGSKMEGTTVAPAGTRLSPPEPTGLSLAPKGTPEVLSLVDDANTRLDTLQSKIKDTGKGLELEPIPETPAPKPAGDIPFEQVAPEQLRTQQAELPLQEKGLDFTKEAIPQVADEGVPFGMQEQVPAQLELPINKPLGQTGFGKGQSGGLNLGAFMPGKKAQTLEASAKIVSKDKWIADFTKQYPDKAGVAEAVYNKLAVDANGKLPLAQELKTNRILDPIVSAGKSSVKGLDYALGSVETRLSNNSPRLGQRLVNYEQANLANTGRRLQSVDPFLESVHTVKPELRGAIERALVQNDKASLDVLLKDKPELRKQFNDVQRTVKELGQEAIDTGVLEKLREDYVFPRVVKDYEGLLNAMGRERSAPLVEAIAAAKAKALKDGRTLSPIEESMVINKFLRGYGTPKYKTPFSKDRTFKEIPDELLEYYASPSESLHTYIRSLTTNIEEYKLFGRNLKKNPDGTMNLDSSIGALVRDELNAGKMSMEQILESADILKARFGSGTRGTTGAIQTMKDITHGALLGSVESAAIQLADVYPSIAINGIKPTFQAIIKKAIGKESVTTNDLGLVNVISEDFVGTRWSTKLVNSIFKPFFTNVDRVIKDVNLNASLLSSQQAVKGANKAKLDKFVRDYQPRFGEDFPQLVKDLQEGKRTLLTDQLVFNELHNRQPISRSKRSEWHLNNPNVGGLVFTLKTFAMSQADMFRKYVYNEIKKGNKKEGLMMAAKLSAAFYVTNASLQAVKNYWLYGELQPDDDAMFGALAKTFGWNDYISEDLQKAAFGSALAKTTVTQMDALSQAFQSFKARVDGDPMTAPSQKDLKLIPWVGGKLYARTPEAQAAYTDKRFKQLEKDMGME